MADTQGGLLGGLFGDRSEILFFILLFLCLFYSYSCCGRKC